MAVSAYGVDIAHYQTLSNAIAVRQNNITFAWHKATQSTNYRDTTFAAHTNSFKAAGITTGAYHFATAGSASAQAKYFRSVAGSCLGKGALWPCLDMEDASVRGNANAFINQFYDALGAGCLVVYGNLDWWQHVFNPAAWGNRNILGWIARYNGNPGNPGYTYPKMAVHQHSDAGNVPGLSKCDRDVIFNGFKLADLTIGGSSGGATAAPSSAPGGIETMAFGDKYEDWAGNSQTVKSWMDNIDKRIYQIWAGVNRYPNPVYDKNNTDGSDMKSHKDYAMNDWLAGANLKGEWANDKLDALTAKVDALAATQATGGVDVSALAEELKTALAPDIVQALGEKLVGDDK